MCILGFDAPRCSGPIFSQKHKFSYCSSRCLDPGLAIVTAVELDSISYKLFLFQGRSPPVLVRRCGAHAAAFTRTRLSWTVAWKDLSFPGQVVESLFYFRECRFSGSDQALSRPDYGVTCARLS